MTLIATPSPEPGYISGRAPARFTTAQLQPTYSFLQEDFRQIRSTLGVVKDRVMLKTSPTAPEVPFARARVWLLRLVDGYKAWEGYSDPLGYYRATGLEVGVAYAPFATDMTAMHKCTAGGPVVALQE